MSKLSMKAVHAITRAKEPGKAGDKAKGIPPVRPVTEDIKPGTIFNAASQKEFDFLKGSGAAIPNSAKADVEDSSTDDTPKAVADMNKAELVAYAAENEIGIDEKAKVADIRKQIEEAEADDGDGDGDGDGDLV